MSSTIRIAYFIPSFQTGGAILEVAVNEKGETVTVLDVVGTVHADPNATFAWMLAKHRMQGPPIRQTGPIPLIAKKK